MIKTKYLKTAVSLLLSVVLILSLAASASAADAVTTTVTVKQTVNGEADAFYDYAIVPKDEANPMPEGTADGEFIFTLQDTSECKTNLSFDRPGIYEYQIGRLNGNGEFDDSAGIHDFGVKVTAEDDGSLTAVVYTCSDNELKILEDGVVADYIIEGQTTTTTVTTSLSSKSGTKAKSPNTGDPYNLPLLVLIAGISALVLMILLVFKRRRDDDDEEDL